MKAERWMVWTVIGLLALNAALSVLTAIRPVVPVAVLTDAIASLGGDLRIMVLRVQQVEQTLQQAARANDSLRKELDQARKNQGAK